MAEKCKKCGKELPVNSTGKLCGYCLQKKKDTAKKIACIAATPFIIAVCVAAPEAGKALVVAAKKLVGK